MAQQNILRSLRDTADRAKQETVTTPSGYILTKSVAERLEHLRDTNDLDKTALIQELSGMIEIALNVQGGFEFYLTDPEPVKGTVKPAPKSKLAFTAAFLNFLADGDFSQLQDNGDRMSPEMYRATRDFIFCNVKKIAGTSVVANFHSNNLKLCAGTLQAGVECHLGPMVIFNRKGIIYDAAQCPDFDERARTFNWLAAKSKPAKT